MAATFEQAQTRLSLLVRLTRPGPGDERAWREFVDYYAPAIYRWCAGRGLQDSDAQDVTQQVLLQLATKLPAFTYDPSRSFRSWLRTLTHHAWADFLSGRDAPASGHPGAWAALSSAEAREDLLRRLEDEFDLELLERAMARVRGRVEPGTWEAFRLTALEGLPAADAARRLGKQVANVYVLRGNVQKLLQAEVAELEAARAPPTDRPAG
jgi:RNA polymerase sigma-70 factor (ECF subfamily)